MKGGQTSRSLVEFVDLFPTVADVCGMKMPHEVAGVSLRPILEHPEASVKEAAFTLVSRRPKLYGQSIRTTRWRLTNWSDGETELYDHDQDPEELSNVSRRYPDIVNELAKQLQAIGKPQR